MTTPPPRRRAESFTFWYLGVSSAVLVALIVIIVVLMFRVERVIGAQRDSNITQCQLANTARLQDIAIWNRLLQIPPAAARAETPAQKAEVADLKRLVRAKDTPRDCQSAYPK